MTKNTNAFPRKAILLSVDFRGPIVSLAGGSQCEPVVDIILREDVTCLYFF